MKKISAIILGCVLAMSSVVLGQQAAPATAAEQPTREEVVQLLEVMNARKNMETALVQMVAAMRQGARQAFLQKVPDASPELLKKLDAVFQDADKVITIDDMFDSVIPIYQRNLDRNEVKALTAFYSSDIGKSFLQKMPQIMTESMKAGSSLAQDKMGAWTAMSDKRMDEFVDEARKEKAAKSAASKPAASSTPAKSKSATPVKTKSAPRKQN